jgi:hypothetical protein
MNKINNTAFLVFVALVSACGQVAQNATATNTAQISPTASTIPPSATPAPTLPPVDIEFQIDCSSIDVGKLAVCDSYLNTTRDLAYPQLRRLTGISLADCYSVVDYTIRPASENIGGFTGENHITYSETYSVDSQPYDVHELFHAFSYCSGALDAHIFHGAMVNAVFFALDDPEYSQYPTEADTNDEFQRIVTGIPALAESKRFDLCRQPWVTWSLWPTSNWATKRLPACIAARSIPIRLMSPRT